MLKPLVLFHGQCPDGMGAALAAYQRFGETAEYRPAFYGMDPPTEADVAGRDVYILDFSYPRKTVEALYEAAGNLILLDHHKTAQEALQGLPYAVFDQSHSGAYLAWNYFHPDTGIPELVELIEARDLWNLWHPDVNKTAAYLRMVGYGVDKLSDWQDLLEYWDLRKHGVLAEGGAIVRYQDTQTKLMVDRAEPIVLAGHRTLAANATSLYSEVAGELAKRTGTFGVAWFWDGVRGIAQVSLRSVESFDVSGLAKIYKGGGHAQAAGFTWPSLPWAEPAR